MCFGITLHTYGLLGCKPIFTKLKHEQVQKIWHAIDLVQNIGNSFRNFGGRGSTSTASLSTMLTAGRTTRCASATTGRTYPAYAKRLHRDGLQRAHSRARQPNRALPRAQG